MRDSRGSTPASSLPQKLFAKDKLTLGESIVPGIVGDAQGVLLLLRSGLWKCGGFQAGKYVSAVEIELRYVDKQFRGKGSSQ
jgi:hypothetical protein